MVDAFQRNIREGKPNQSHDQMHIKNNSQQEKVVLLKQKQS